MRGETVKCLFNGVIGNLSERWRRGTYECQAWLLPGNSIGIMTAWVTPWILVGHTATQACQSSFSSVVGGKSGDILMFPSCNDWIASERMFPKLLFYSFLLDWTPLCSQSPCKLGHWWSVDQNHPVHRCPGVAENNSSVSGGVSFVHVPSIKTWGWLWTVSRLAVCLILAKQRTAQSQPSRLDEYWIVILDEY